MLPFSHPGHGTEIPQVGWFPSAVHGRIPVRSGSCQVFYISSPCISSRYLCRREQRSLWWGHRRTPGTPGSHQFDRDTYTMYWVSTWKAISIRSDQLAKPLIFQLPIPVALWLPTTSKPKWCVGEKKSKQWCLLTHMHVVFMLVRKCSKGTSHQIPYSHSKIVCLWFWVFVVVVSLLPGIGAQENSVY